VTVLAEPAAQWPAKVVAPYVDMTLYPTYNLSSAVAQGVKYFSLAFITAGTRNQPVWGGYATYSVDGGDVVVSCGGAAGQELAQVVADVNSLAAAYRAVIDAYHLTHIDFDIEGAA